MKRIFIVSLSFVISMASLSLMAGSKGQGEKCFADNECSFGLTCTDGACVKKKEFDFGSSGKTGQPCSIDADCINSGKCVQGTFGKKVCSGN